MANLLKQKEELKIDQVFSSNDYPEFVEYCIENKLIYFADIELVDFVMFKNLFGVSSEQASLAKLKWQEIRKVYEGESLESLEEFKKNGNICLQIQDRLNDKLEHQHKAEFDSNFVQPSRKADNIIREVLGNEMYEYGVDNPEKIYIFSRLLQYTITQFNNENNITNEIDRNILQVADVVGEEMTLACLRNPQLIYDITHLFLPLLKKGHKSQENREKVLSLYKKIPVEVCHARLGALCQSILPRESNLYKIIREKNMRFVHELFKIDVTDWDKGSIDDLLMLLGKLSTDLRSNIIDDLSDLFRKNHRKEIILNRALGQTLELIGNRMSLSRERIRQIEAKVQEDFDCNNSKRKYLSTLAAFSIKENLVYLSQIKNDFADLAEPLIYLLIKSESNYYIYSSELEAFIIDDFSWYDEVEKQIDEWQDMLHENELEENIRQLTSSLDIDYYYDEVALIAKKKYKISGQYYHRSLKSLSMVYKTVMEKCYPSGLRLYDKSDLLRFRKNITNMFGEDIRLPANDRAIDARVADFGILCDRGKYTLPQFINIDKFLIEEIVEYINKSSRNTFSFLELFARFKVDLLKNSNVNNHYYLQGVLKYYYKNQFFFTRDTISKIKKQTGFLVELENFVESMGSVTKSDIKTEFKGVTEAMLLFTIMKSRHIVFIDNGQYMHSSLLDVIESDYDKLENIINSNICNMPVSSRKLLDLLYVKYPDFLNRNNIFTHSKLFGILHYMFWEQYQFSRPFIGKLDDMDGISTIGIVREYLNGCKDFAISHLLEYCKDNHLHFLSYAGLIRSLSDEYIRVDCDLCINIEEINIDDNNIAAIEKVVIDLIKPRGYKSIKNITDFMFFPDIGIAWTGFLLESIINSLFDSIRIIEIPTSNSYILSSIIVASELNVNSYEEFIRYVIKNEHNNMPFRSIEEIETWLKKEGLINSVLPKIITDEGYVSVDEYGKVIIA